MNVKMFQLETNSVKRDQSFVWIKMAATQIASRVEILIQAMLWSALAE